MGTKRQAIRIGAAGPLLKVIKVTKEKAYTELTDEGLEITFGYIDASVPYSNIDSVEVAKWPLVYGIGLRPGRDKSMGYIGAGGEAVWITLKEPQELMAGPAGMTMKRHKVAISIEDPPSFASALQARIG